MTTNHYTVINLTRGIAAVALLLSFATPAAAEGVSAGSLIENKAVATYNDGSATQSVESNKTVLKVDELLDVTVTALDSGPLASAPGEAVLTFELTNKGNGPEAFELSADPAVAGNDFDASIEDIAIDSNGNGTYDPGVDAILASPQTTPVLAADAALTVFVLTTLPDTINDADESDVELTARAVTGTGAPGTAFAGQGENGSDGIVGLTNGDGSATGSLIAVLTSVDLVKSASIVDPFGGDSVVPGALVTVKIRANVTGLGTVANLVVTSAIPAGTTYKAGTLALDSNALTDEADDDAGEANTTQISVNLGSAPGGTSHDITFDVTVD